MQHPTCISIRIRSTTDAHKIFGAIQQGILHMVTRRLDADERLALRSGCVYAWEERGPHSELTGLGIERFTEGRRWSPSRVRDEFLFYYEKYSPPPADANHLGSPERQPPRDWDPLVKQTYSVWVQTDNGRRKWHLTAYFTQATIDQLGTIDDDPRIKDIVVSDGMFKSTRVGKGRIKTEDGNRTDAARAATTVPRTYAPFPTPYQYQAQNGSPSMNPVLMHEPYQNRPSELVQSPSPVSPHAQSPFIPSRGYPGSNESTASSSYISPAYATSPSPVPRSMVSGTPTPNYHLSSMPRSQMPHDQYPKASSSSWDANNTFYSRSERHATNADIKYQSYSSSGLSSTGRSSSPQTVASPQAYRLPPASTMGPAQIYSPSYSLQSALALPSSSARELADVRGPTLSPLQIPDQAQSGLHTIQPSFGHGSPSSMSMHTGMDAEYALAPLTLPRPSNVKYVRYSEDEKSLRLLRDDKISRYLREEARGSN